MRQFTSEPDSGRVADTLRVDLVALATYAPQVWPFETVMDSGPAAALEQLPHDVARNQRANATRLLEQAQTSGVRAIVPGDKEWPTPIEALNRDGGSTGAPLCLWVRGPKRLTACTARSVLITGSRAATEYGQHIAQLLANDLASSRYASTIANAGQFGVDAAALNGALTAYDRIEPLVVLACGIDGTHPNQHSGLFRHVAETGLLISVNPPGTLPTRQSRQYALDLLAALTSATVVVEALERHSSCLVSARRAAAMGRPVFAVPGPVTSVHSGGCHELIRDGSAHLATNSRDIAERLPGFAS